MKKRSLNYEDKFRKYLFNFDYETHLEIVKNINLQAKEMKGGLKE